MCFACVHVFSLIRVEGKSKSIRFGDFMQEERQVYVFTVCTQPARGARKVDVVSTRHIEYEASDTSPFWRPREAVGSQTISGGT